MPRSQIYLIVGAVVFIVPFISMSLYRSAINFGGGSFDCWGFSWIVCKSAFYTLTSIVILTMIFNIIDRSKVFLVALLVVALLIFIEIQKVEIYPYCKITVFDDFVHELGYFVSRLFPYKPKDTAMNSAAIAALPPQTKLSADTDIGAIEISTGSHALRKISLNGFEQSLDVQATLSNPKVLYFPKNGWSIVPEDRFIPIFSDERWPGDCWIRNSGISRCSYWEGIQDFKSEKEALEWIANGNHRHIPFIYRNDGICLGYSKTFANYTLSLEVWQILIDGEKLHQLSGSKDEKIEISKI